MAIEAGSEGAQTQLQETYSKTMTLAEAEVLALNTLKQVHVLPPPFTCGVTKQQPSFTHSTIDSLIKLSNKMSNKM